MLWILNHAQTLLNQNTGSTFQWVTLSACPAHQPCWWAACISRNRYKDFSCLSEHFLSFCNATEVFFSHPRTFLRVNLRRSFSTDLGYSLDFFFLCCLEVFSVEWGHKNTSWWKEVWSGWMAEATEGISSSAFETWLSWENINSPAALIPYVLATQHPSH